MAAGVLCLLCLGFNGRGAVDNTNSNSPAPDALRQALAKGQSERKNGHFAQAVSTFEHAADLARQSGDTTLQAHALVAVTGCEIRLFDYRRALTSSDAALRLARQASDDSAAGAASGNTATIYSQLGDYSLAEKAAAESVSYLRKSSRKDYLARALLNYGDIQSRLGQIGNSITSFESAVTVARSAGISATEAMAQDHMGESLLEAGDLRRAEKALLEAQRLRLQMKDTDALALTTENLAWLAYLKGDYRPALAMVNEVLASGSGALSEVPQYWQFELRGRILLSLHRPSEALASLSRAVVAANNFRRAALPGDASRTRTVVELHEVYRDYIALAASLSLQRQDPKLARQAYDVLVQNRASNLREQMLSSLGREMRLPPRYYDLLSQLENAQAFVTLGTDPTTWQKNNDKLQQIRLQLADLENKIGVEQGKLSFADTKAPGASPLGQIQRNLSGEELLLSFCLDKDQSFLWAVSRTEVKLYRLPVESKIAAEASAFSRKVQKTGPDAEGQTLSHELFGQIGPTLARKREWLIAADGALLDNVPFSALRGYEDHEFLSPLCARHTVRFLPSELLLTDLQSSEPRHSFVGVADPIYNLADSRRSRSLNLLPLSLRHNSNSLVLARLVGSDREVRTAGKESGSATVRILTGASASRAKLRDVLAEPPQILHFAVHVVGPDGRNNSGSTDSLVTGDAALALSLGEDNMPELLTKEAIASLRVPGTLVVLSGCDSQQGEILPSAGLMGLSRAWLLAGASAVLVSAWPTPDDSGQFFAKFYGHLEGHSSNEGNLAKRAAAALQETQLDMQRTSGYRSSPSFWAAYSLISKE